MNEGMLPHQVAALVGVSVETLQRYRMTRGFPSPHIKPSDPARSRERLYDRDEVEAWLAANPSRASRDPDWFEAQQALERWRTERHAGKRAA